MTPMTSPGLPADELVPGARHAIAPAGIVSTGWPRIKNTCRNIGWRFDPWQDAVGRLILAKKACGGWAADLSIMSIPRQVGKSYLLGCIIFALCLLTPKLRVIWTSHHTATTEEMYEAMKELAEHRRVKPHVRKCVALQGSRWRISFRNGSRIDFGARSQGFGRGKSKVGVLVLDEFQHISSRALANLVPTANTADNPLILCAGTPPGPEVTGEAFIGRRKAALDRLSTDTMYVEFAADANADLDDRKQWAKANPSFPKRTPERAMLLMRKMLDDEDFRREALGVWDESRHVSIVAPAAWSALVSDGPAVDVAPAALAVDMSHRRDISVVAAWPVDDRLHVEEVWAGIDVAAAVSWLSRAAGRRIPVLIDSYSPAVQMVPMLESARVKVKRTSTREMAAGAQIVESRLGSGSLTHAGQSSVTLAVMAAVKRPIGDAGGFGWDRKDQSKQIHPLVAMSLAVAGASGGKRRSGPGGGSGFA
jgi:phage terminase large subunit-like protein